MKQKIKDNSKKYIIVPIAAVGLMAILVFSSVDAASAHGSTNNRDGFAKSIAKRFNLNETEVEDAMQEYGQNHYASNQQEMHDRIEERLANAVEEGNLSEAQKFAILDKFEDMHTRLEDLHDQDLSRDDFHELRADIHEEMQAWADEQGIDFDIFMRTGKRMMGNGMRHFSE